MNSTGLWVPSKKDKKKYKDMEVAIVTPCGDYEVNFKFYRAVANLVAYSWMQGLKVYEVGGVERMCVHWARNMIARDTVDRINPHTGNKFTHLLWLDDDQIFNADMLLYLARNGHLDMVSAVYYCRVGAHLPVAYVKDDEPNIYSHYPLIQIPETVFEIDAVGFGAVLMRRDVLDRVEDPYFQFGTGDNHCGEDIYFCTHAKQAGVRIWLDGSYRIAHIGEPEIVSHSTYLKYCEDNKEHLSDRVEVPLGGNINEQVGSGETDPGI